MRIRIGTSIAIGLTLLAWNGISRAEVSAAEHDGVQTYVFSDDKLLTSNLGPDQAKITTRGGPVRTILVRPRLHFIPELLQSVENL